MRSLSRRSPEGEGGLPAFSASPSYGLAGHPVLKPKTFLHAISRSDTVAGARVASRLRMPSPPHIVYILESIAEPARHYTGLTTNANGRLAWHNAGLSRHTSKHRPWRLLVVLEFADPSCALRFEKYLKTGSGRAFAKRHFGPDISSS